MSNLRDLVGQRFGKLIVLERALNNRNGHVCWRCRCDCGNEHVVAGCALTAGTTKSCKCAWRVFNEAHKQWRGCGEIPGRYWSSLTRNAQERDLVVSVSINDAWELFLKQERRCALTGLELTFGGKAREWASKTASLDRIQSMYGYTINNIQWIHKRIQWMKSDMQEIEFIRWCEVIVKHAHNDQTTRAA